MTTVISHPTSPESWGAFFRAYNVKSIGGEAFQGERKEEEAGVYMAIREIVLSHEIDRGVLEDGDQNRVHLAIRFASQCAVYKNPRTGMNESIDLLSIENDELQTLLDKYYTLTGAKKLYHEKIKVRAHSKGDLNGDPSLQRNTEALKALPNSFDHAFKSILPSALSETRLDKNTVSKRLLFVEYFHKKLSERVEAKIQEKTNNRQNTNEERHQKILDEEINELNDLKQKLDNLDIYALGQALSVYPTGCFLSNHLTEIADSLENRMGQDALKNVKKSLNPFKKKQLSEKEAQYNQDVANLLYTGRDEYFQNCEKKGISRKQENTADIFFREAVSSGKSEKKYTGEGFKKSLLFADLPEALKQELEKDVEEIATLSNHAIDDAREDEYSNDPENPGKSLQESIDAQRERVNNDLKIEDIPPELRPQNRENSTTEENSPEVPNRALVPRSVIGGVVRENTPMLGTLAAYGGAALLESLELVPSSPMWLARAATEYIQDYPGRIYGTLSGLKTVAEFAVSYVYPETRDAEGNVQKTFSKKRAALVGGVAIGALYVGMTMYEAVNDGAIDGSVAERAGYLFGRLAQGAFRMRVFNLGLDFGKKVVWPLVPSPIRSTAEAVSSPVRRVFSWRKTSSTKNERALPNLEQSSKGIKSRIVDVAVSGMNALIPDRLFEWGMRWMPTPQMALPFAANPA